MKKILIIQTAFIGDVILATSLIETIAAKVAHDSVIDILVRKGNEALLEGHPRINKVLVWDKKGKKYKNLLRLSKTIRFNRYDTLFNLQRFASTGFLTCRSKAQLTVGFKGNPLAFLFDKKVPHEIGTGAHEIERNVKLLEVALNESGIKPFKPKLYPLSQQIEKVTKMINGASDFIVMAPASVWFTKQLPEEKWVELITLLAKNNTIYLIGGPGDHTFLETLIVKSGAKNCLNTAGQLNLLESAVLISKAKRTYVNDSAPLHLSSAMNAPVTAFFCSTIPEFGFGPLSDDTQVLQATESLDCRPCGLHGHKSCPKGHFRCGKTIDFETIIS